MPITYVHVMTSVGCRYFQLLNDRAAKHWSMHVQQGPVPNRHMSPAGLALPNCNRTCCSLPCARHRSAQRLNGRCGTTLEVYDVPVVPEQRCRLPLNAMAAQVGGRTQANVRKVQGMASTKNPGSGSVWGEAFSCGLAGPMATLENTCDYYVTEPESRGTKHDQ